MLACLEGAQGFRCNGYNEHTSEEKLLKSKMLKGCEENIINQSKLVLNSGKLHGVMMEDMALHKAE